ncbi:MAG TPA: alpha/beta hydrolase [Alphaproteobacteria bacterium]
MIDLGFTHIFEKGNPIKPVLLLLHGTGGNEQDLIGLAKDVAPDAGILSVRGKVLENGMPRFFKRLAEGVFDLEDLKLRTAELVQFITDAKAYYGLQDRALYALGYSNGANIASSVLFSAPQALDGAILLRGMVPFYPDPLPDLTGKAILLLSGAFDEIMSAEEAKILSGLFERAGADVTFVTQPAGHGLVQPDIEAMRTWLEDK